MTTEPYVGERRICSQCGDQIVFIGPYWDHPGDIKPKHPAIPVDAQIVAEWNDRLRSAEANAARWKQHAQYWYGQRDDLRDAIKCAAAKLPHWPDSAATILSDILAKTSGEVS